MAKKKKPDPPEALCARCTPSHDETRDKAAKEEAEQLGRQVQNSLRRGFSAYCFVADGKKWVRELNP